MQICQIFFSWTRQFNPILYKFKKLKKMKIFKIFSKFFQKNMKILFVLFLINKKPNHNYKSVPKLLSKIMYIIVISSLSCSIYAQNQIAGIITDNKTKDVLPGVNVYLLDHNKGAVTNEKGKYYLNNLSKGTYKIQFSFIGYKTIVKTLKLNKSKIKLDIQLRPTMIQSQGVVISGAYTSLQHENPLKIEVINSKELNNSGTPNFIEAISRVPGIDMISKGPGVAKPVIRGLSMTNILLLNNGVRMENFQFSVNHPFIVDEFGLDRIEIIKGPASLLYGSDAIGGVINLIKEKPAPVGKTIGDYNIKYYSNTKGIVSNLGIKGSTENFSWGIRAGIKNHEDYKDGNGNFVPNTRFNEKVLKANIGMNKSFGTFKIYYDYNRPKLGMCVPPAIAQITKDRRDNNIWYQDLTNHLISSRNKLFLGNFKLDINAAYQMNNRKLQTDDSKPQKEMVDMDLNTFTYEIKTYLPSNEKSKYIIGIQGMDKNNSNNKAPMHIIPDANINDISFFGLAQHTFFKKLKAQAGLRYGKRSINTHSEGISGESGYKPKIDKSFKNISGAAGATYKINDYFLIRANFASGFRSPNLAELTENGMHGVRYEQGDANLKAQRNCETDLNIHYHLRNIMLDVSGFYNNINDYIFLSPTGDTTNNGYKIYRYSQINAKLYGGEAGINISPVKRINIRTTYSYVIGKEDNGEYLPFIPANKIKFELKTKKEKLGFIYNAFGILGTTTAFEQDNAAMFETKTNGYTLTNLEIGGKVKCVKQMLNISVNINNLFNIKYYDHLSTLKPMGYYNPGRNININLKIPFGIK